MMGWWDGIFGAAVAATCGCCCALPQDARPNIACGGETVARATVSRIIDGRTFVLGDGHEVRLAAIEVPPLPPPNVPNAQSAPGGTASKGALDALVGCDEVVLRQADPGPDHNLDRYGRIVAYAYALRDGTELFAQGELIASGFARVADRIGSKTCAAELLADPGGQAWPLGRSVL